MASLIVAGTFTIAANAASGFEPEEPTPIPESAFEAVVIPAAGFRMSVTTAPAPSATPDLRRFVDPQPRVEPPTRPQPDVPEPKPIVVEKLPPTTHVIRGIASWYCRAGVSPCTAVQPDGAGVDAYAAAGPRLRAAIGPGWRGTVITVDGIRVQLIDWCQCYRGEPHEKLLDLYYDVYRQTGTDVTVRW